jgi:hypothetical protein
MKRCLILCLVLFLAISAGFAGVYWRSCQIQRSAEAALQDARQLVVGVSSFSDIQRLSKRYGPYLKPSSESCDPNACDLSLIFDNRWLEATRFARGTMFMISVALKANKVTWVRLFMSTGEGVGAARVFVEQLPIGAQAPAYDIGGKVQTDPPRHAILITARFTPEAASSAKDSALGFNLFCLTEFRACQFSEDMLPRVYAELDAKGSR